MIELSDMELNLVAAGTIRPPRPPRPCGCGTRTTTVGNSVIGAEVNVSADTTSTVTVTG